MHVLFTYQVAMMRVLSAVPIWSLGPMGPALRADTYVSRAGYISDIVAEYL